MKEALPTVYRFDTCCFSGLKIRYCRNSCLFPIHKKCTKIAADPIISPSFYFALLVKFSSECAPNTQTFRVQPFIASHLPLDIANFGLCFETHYCATLDIGARDTGKLRRFMELPRKFSDKQTAR